jgi:hypothetical protein
MFGKNPQEIPFEVVNIAGFAITQKSLQVFNSLEDFEKFYISNSNIANPDKNNLKIDVDFNKETLIAISLGMRPTSGYSINVNKVLKEKGKILIQASEICPKKNQIVLMVITYPSILIKIPKNEGQFELDLKTCKPNGS